MKHILKQFTKFIIVSIIGIIINLNFLFIITEYLNVYYLISYFLASIFSGTSNFFLNKHWTFKEHTLKVKHLAKQYSKFFIINITLQIIGAFALYYLTDIVGLFYINSQIIVLSVIWTILFIFHKIWVFKK